MSANLSRFIDADMLKSAAGEGAARLGSRVQLQFLPISDIPYKSEFRKEIAMGVATVTTKGQLTIPADVRAEFGIEAGDRLEFVSAGPTLMIRKLSATAEDFFASLSGFEKTGFTGTDDEAIGAALIAKDRSQAAPPPSKRKAKAA